MHRLLTKPSYDKNTRMSRKSNWSIKWVWNIKSSCVCRALYQEKDVSFWRNSSWMLLRLLFETNRNIIFFELLQCLETSHHKFFQENQVSFRIQSKFGKIWSRKTPNTDTFQAVQWNRNLVTLPKKIFHQWNIRVKRTF